MYPKPPDFSRYDDRVAVIYRPAGISGRAFIANVRIDERPGFPVGGPAVPGSAAHPVRVNGHPAVDVHGTYEAEPGGPARWNPDADVAELSWRADGRTYLLSASGPVAPSATWCGSQRRFGSRAEHLDGRDRRRGGPPAGHHLPAGLRRRSACAFMLLHITTVVRS